MSNARVDSLPCHDELSFFARLIEISSILTSSILIVWHLCRLILNVNAGDASTMLAVAIVGMFAADFVSGLVHWTADTWGSETMPIFGKRFLRPFRVHHVNPHDFLRRNFIDTNGDVAMLLIPFVAVGFCPPMNEWWGQLSLTFLMAFCATTLPTNQVHQWAHMPIPPRWIQGMQNSALILRKQSHSRHHTAPYVQNYCIATGWCNPLLNAFDFFARCERFITWTTGLQPRSDDSAFQNEIEISQMTKPRDASRLVEEAEAHA